MADMYPGTQLLFEGWSLKQLRDPVLDGPGSGAVELAAGVYSDLAAGLAKAADDLRAVLRVAQGAHEGEAADASRRHIARLAQAGDDGAVQAQLAAIALQEQAAFHARVRTDMQALAEADNPAKRLPSVPAIIYERAEESARVAAVDAAERYQSNTNHNLGATFQMFEPPPETTPDVSTAPSMRDPGWPAADGGPGGAAIGAAGGGSPEGARTPAPSALGGSTAASASTATAAGGSAVGPGVGPASLPVRGAGGGTGADRAGGGGPELPRAGLAATTQVAGVDGTGSIARRTGASAADGLRTPGGTGTSGWVPGQPWSARASEPGAGGGLSSRGASLPEADSQRLASRTAPNAGPGTSEPATRGSGSVRPGSTGYSGLPLMSGAAVAGGQDTDHPRPPWLLEDDPDAVWFAGLPQHTPPVIGGSEGPPTYT